jgi:protein-S-isoprenylcysteine O-methyltransferase Ste14
MTAALHALIPVLWILWLAYWVVAARATHQTQRREGFGSRLSHYGPLIVGGLCLGVPNILGAEMEQPFHSASLTWLLLANALVVVGLGFSALARMWLGRNWSAEVTVKQGHELVRSGPYALVRHPIYAGLLLALTGSALVVGKWRALIGLVLMVAALLRKLTIEERFMAEQFGEAYAHYRAEVPALIPFLV